MLGKNEIFSGEKIVLGLQVHYNYHGDLYSNKKSILSFFNENKIKYNIQYIMYMIYNN